jgi:hypothetical protein
MRSRIVTATPPEVPAGGITVLNANSHATAQIGGWTR